MRKLSLFAIAITAVFASCSHNDLVDDNNVVQKNNDVPIEFSVQKQNITRAANLETVKHYNFGVWAWKVNGKDATANPDQEVMNHYLVGYSGNNVGYDHTNATTWAAAPGDVKNHVSPWFYEGLGTSEYAYTGDAGFYTTANTSGALYQYNDYKSVNTHQYLRYWDLAYTNTNFYCYAPYNANVTFSKTNNTMTFPATAIRDGYDEPLNSSYNAYSRTLGEFMYAGKQATNASLSDVTIPFKHMGAQLFIRFYEDIPGYKVELIDLTADNGTPKSGISGDQLLGIQATPSVGGTSAGTYYITQGATVNYATSVDNPICTANWEGSTTATNTTPLMFKIPTAGLSTADVAPANLTDYAGLNSTTHKIIAEAGAATGGQTYSYSPTIYYPVAQKTSSTTGFTFHVSYRIIAEDNKEVITVHNATVYVPVTGKVETGTTDSPITSGGTDYYITAWQPNVKYTYTFKITRDSNGTTNPDTPIDPTDPTVPTTKSLYPIVFDEATIEDWSTNYSEYKISEETTTY